ncbi:MAG: DNA helicase UvrD, partial [Candidatus Aenigmatarchaeota archaeon]
MKVVSDFHIHGRYSRATSKQLNVPNLVKYAKMKGVGLLGTGDFTHPQWLEELKGILKEDGSGIPKDESGFPFILSAEISSIYSDGGKVRRIHNVLLAPSFDVVDQINEALRKKGVNLNSDGRPICGIKCPELVEIVKGVDRSVEVIPAH